MLWFCSNASAYFYSNNNNNGFTLIYFTGNDNIYIPTTLTVNALLVGGGGGGGNLLSDKWEGTGGGGGGGVGVVFMTLQGGSTYSITVGYPGGSGGAGGNTIIQGNGVHFLVYGGGGGGGGGGTVGQQGPGGNGGSGGGGNGLNGDHPGGSWQPGICYAGCNQYAFYGNNGGTGNIQGSGGGGGGASAFYWPDATDYFAGGGGGGGGSNNCNNAHGWNGGMYAGRGSDGGSPGVAATKANSGSGGGGAGCENGKGGGGASGVVIFAYCGAGTYQVATPACVPCPAGTASTLVGLPSLDSCHACPAGSYSNSGATSCSLCPVGQYSGSPGSGSCSSCPPGTYSASPGATSCTQCPPGTYNSNSGSTSQSSCTACPAGTANVNYGASSGSSCVPCVAGYYSPTTGAAACSACHVGHFSPSRGLSICSVCPPFAYYTPPGSSACHCNPVQTSVNLCSIFFQSDITLNSYTASYSNSTDVYGVSQYLLNLLKIEVDINGDRIISRTEITAALNYRSIQSSALASIPVWNNANYTDSVPVADLFHDAITLFTTSAKHTFDGSGADDLLSITSTYPSTNWNSDLCFKYDSFLNPNFSPVSVAWQYSQPYPNIVAGGLAQVCGYVNGRLINDFDVSYDLNDGYQTNLLDSGADSDLSFKRVYCLVTWHNDFTSQYQCSLGLFYVNININELINVFNIYYFYPGWYSY